MKKFLIPLLTLSMLAAHDSYSQDELDLDLDTNYTPGEFDDAEFDKLVGNDEEEEEKDSEASPDEVSDLQDDFDSLELDGDEELNSQKPELKEIKLTADSKSKPIPEEFGELDQEELEASPEGNAVVLEEFSKLREANIKEIISERVKNSERKFTNSRLRALKVQLKDISKSSTFVAYIPRGKRLVNLKTDKLKYTTKGISVRAHSLLDYDNYRYVLDKEGNLAYKIYYTDITRITRITELYHKPHKFTRLKKKIKIDTPDKDFNYSIKLNLHSGLNISSFTKNLIKDANNYGLITRVDGTVQTYHQFPFQVGFTGAFETISTPASDKGNLNQKTFSFGPSFKKNNFIGKYGAIVQARAALFSELRESRSTATNTYNLTETSLLFAVEKETLYKGYGHFNFGYFYQRKWMRANAKGFALDIGNQSDADNSLGFYIGHRSDWIW